MLRGKKVLVTGGAGFLGQHLIAQLQERGVRPEDIFVPRIEEYDLRTQTDADRAFTTAKPDIVFHLAAVGGGVTFLKEHPGTVLHDNITLHTTIIDTARRHKVQKFVAIGSGLIYPASAPKPLREDTIWEGYPHETTACYGVAARALLSLVQEYRREFALDAIFLIPSNLYGPGDHFFAPHPHVIPATIRKLDDAHGAPITLFGTGEAAREFLYVKDAARAIVTAAQEYSSPEPMNLGTGVATPIREIAAAIKDALGSTSEIAWDATQPEGERVRCFDVSRMRDALSYAPHTSLADGLRETITWYRTEKARRAKEVA